MGRMLMNEASHYLLNLARRMAQNYVALTRPEAIMVTGSVAQGQADFYSDLDMTLYYSALPSEDELELAHKKSGGGPRLWTLGSRDEGVLVEAFPVEEVECQLGHSTIATWEREMSQILEQLDIDSPLQKALYGMLICIPLHGESLIRHWKTQIADYPTPLAQAMVEKHLDFFPLWSMSRGLTYRDADLWMHQVLVETLHNILGVLSGLNHLYYSPFQFKHMDAFISQMAIAPPDLSSRLKHLLRIQPVDFIPQLRELVSETVALVELHLPAVNTSKARQQLSKCERPWTIQSNTP